MRGIIDNLLTPKSSVLVEGLLSARTKQTSDMVDVGKIPRETVVRTAHALGGCISDQWKQRKISSAYR